MNQSGDDLSPTADPAVTREELHFRCINMRGFRRSDGLFEVEGRVTDYKPHDFVAASGGRQVPAGEPIHDMGVRLVYDDQLRVQDVSTITNAAPYAQCPEGGRALQSMKGVRMVSGWNAEVRNRLRGAQSCTHLMELLIPMATVAYQSLSALGNRVDRLDATGRPTKIDNCYAYGAERELVRVRWPEFYRAPAPEE
jgi:hypothetical protein